MMDDATRDSLVEEGSAEPSLLVGGDGDVLSAGEDQVNIVFVVLTSSFC